MICNTFIVAGCMQQFKEIDYQTFLSRGPKVANMVRLSHASRWASDLPTTAHSFLGFMHTGYRAIESTSRRANRECISFASQSSTARVYSTALSQGGGTCSIHIYIVHI